MKYSKDHRIIEALIFGSTEPVYENDMLEKVSKNVKLKTILDDLKKYYIDRGINLIKTGNRWSFRTAEDLYDNYRWGYQTPAELYNNKARLLLKLKL